MPKTRDAIRRYERKTDPDNKLLELDEALKGVVDSKKEKKK